MTKNKLKEKLDFKFENEMVDYMIDPLSKIFNTKNYLTEFQTGNGIPDVIFAQNIDKNNEKFNYNEFSLISRLLRKKNILEDELQNNRIKSYLTSNGYITENNNKFIVQKRKLNAAVENIIAIEAKLSDWKNGFYQALRYRYFANQSYLAIKNVYIKNIDKNLLKEYGIGLISVNENGTKIVLKAKKQKPLDPISNLYSAQQIILKLNEN